MSHSSGTASSVIPRAPGGWPLLGHLPAFFRDPLAFVEANAEGGADLIRIDMAGLPHYQLNNPDYVKALLHDYKNLQKGVVGLERKRVFGAGLATSEGDFWLKQRHLIQPAFSRDKLLNYGAIMADIGQQRIPRWPSDHVTDIHQLFMSVALESVCAVLFNTGVAEQSRLVAEKLEAILDFFSRPASFLYRFLPDWAMTSTRSKFYNDVDTLDRVIQSMITQRRQHPQSATDLLSTLIDARDAQKNAMDDQQLRDEMMTLFLAGHETTALALSWSAALLAEHPNFQETLFQQIDGVLNGRPPAVEDLDSLPLLDALLKESMRLYPPAWILVRKAHADLRFGEHLIPNGSYMTVSQWVLHRHPDNFDDPDDFKPERWLENGGEAKHKYAYIPFGSGPRSCIGRALSLMEASLFLCTLLQHFQLIQGPDGMPKPSPSLSLRPGKGVPVTLKKRPGR